MEQDLYFLHNGIFWKKTRIKVALDGNQAQVLGGNIQTDVGLIFGMSLYADTIDPVGVALITTTQATQLYLNVITGGKQYVPAIRLDDLLNVYAGSPVIRTDKYTPFNIPWWAFDFQTSTISNPTLITGFEVWINLYYIPKSQYNMPALDGEGNSMTKVPAMYTKHTPVPQSETNAVRLPAAPAPNNQ